MNETRRSKSPLNIGIITYDTTHLKTEQLVQRLLFKRRLAENSDFELKLIALPFAPRPAREVLFRHRPDQDQSVSTRELARSHELDFHTCTYDDIPDVADCYIVGGGGILKAAAIGNKKIINVHPGVIPFARGLDAFKWSILNRIPLGVTLHFIDAQVDAGETIAIVKTPIFESDSIEMLARRHYELELDVLCEFRSFLDSPANQIPATETSSHEPRMRMPIATERRMIDGFDVYKREFAASGFGAAWSARGISDAK